MLSCKSNSNSNSKVTYACKEHQKDGTRTKKSSHAKATFQLSSQYTKIIFWYPCKEQSFYTAKRKEAKRCPAFRDY